MRERSQTAYSYLRWKQMIASLKMKYWKRTITLLPSEWQPSLAPRS